MDDINDINSNNTGKNSGVDNGKKGTVDTGDKVHAILSEEEKIKLDVINIFFEPLQKELDEIIPKEELDAKELIIKEESDSTLNEEDYYYLIINNIYDILEFDNILNNKGKHLSNLIQLLDPNYLVQELHNISPYAVVFIVKNLENLPNINHKDLFDKLMTMPFYASMCLYNFLENFKIDGVETADLMNKIEKLPKYKKDCITGYFNNNVLMNI